jgi:succinate-semialdehyde dehydrogenase/glutarate-semialdehyde dehydrogenase
VISTSMELGGNAPLIVLPGADLDTAVDGAFIAKMRNGGSACTAANRCYVHSSLAEDFAACMASELEGWSVGPGIDRETSSARSSRSTNGTRSPSSWTRLSRPGPR